MRRSASSSVVVRTSAGLLQGGAKDDNRGEVGMGGAGSRRSSFGSADGVDSDLADEDGNLIGAESSGTRSKGKGRVKMRRSGSLNSLVEEGDDSAASRGRAMTMVNDERNDLDKDVAEVCANIQKVISP